MGTPEFAVPTLAAIIAEGHVVAAVYTRAPQPGGPRGLEPVPFLFMWRRGVLASRWLRHERFAPGKPWRPCAVSIPML